MKSVSQEHSSAVLQELLQECLVLTYNCVQYGEANNIRNRKEMRVFYRSMKSVDLPSFDKVAATTRGCAVLESRERGRRRGRETKHNKPLKPVACKEWMTETRTLPSVCPRVGWPSLPVSFRGVPAIHPPWRKGQQEKQ